MKVTLNEIKKYLQGTNCRVDEAKNKINDLEYKEEKKNIHSEKQKEKKNKDKLRNLWDNIKHTNIRTIRLPELEEKKQENESLLEKIIKENFPNLVKEIDMQESPGSTESPKQVGPKRTTPRHIITKLPKVKDKERILKAARQSR